MSTPISECLVYRAVSDEAAYTELLAAVRYNKWCGHYLESNQAWVSLVSSP